MSVQELGAILATMPPDDEVVVMIFRADGTAQVFDIHNVTAGVGIVFLKIVETIP